MLFVVCSLFALLYVIYSHKIKLKYPIKNRLCPSSQNFLDFFYILSLQNENIQKNIVPKLPIYCANFLNTTGKIVVSGRRPFFYIYDMISNSHEYVPKIPNRNEKSLEYHIVSNDGTMIAFGGNDGYIILIHAITRTHIMNLKLNGSVRAMTFTIDDNEILASGSDGDIYRFDIRYTRQCIERFSNHDGTITSSIAISKTHLAVGSESGVVNIYSEKNNQSSYSSSFTSNRSNNNQKRIPIKSIMNLKTSIDCMKFNHDDDPTLLSISSKRDPNNALRMIHIPTCSVYSNWPTSKTPLKYVFNTDFSYNNQYFAIGNDKGHCRLYRFKHYC